MTKRLKKKKEREKETRQKPTENMTARFIFDKCISHKFEDRRESKIDNSYTQKYTH